MITLEGDREPRRCSSACRGPLCASCQLVRGARQSPALRDAVGFTATIGTEAVDAASRGRTPSPSETHGLMGRDSESK